MEYDARPAWLDQLGIMVVVALLFLIGIGGAEGTGVLLVAIPAFMVIIIYRRYSWVYSITNGSIESRHGIISRNTKSILIHDLRSINVKQSIIQRTVGTGDVEFSSAGGAGIEVVFYGVPDPERLKQSVRGLQH